MDRNRVQKRETSHLQVITGQPAYEGKSQEELRLEDYRKNLRGPPNIVSAGLKYINILPRIFPTIFRPITFSYITPLNDSLCV